MATRLQAKAFNSRLKVRHLELFRHVFTLRSLRKAADASAMTQPAATKLIQDLEEMLGRPLFVRDRRGMTPTLYDHAVLHHANILLADILAMREEVDLVGQGVAGTIRLGVIPSLSPVVLTDVIGRTLAHWPRIRFALREGSTSQLLRELAGGELDLAFARLIDAGAVQDLDVLTVHAESFAIVCSSRHPLAAKRRVSWNDLTRARWMMPTAGTPLRELVNALFMREKLLVPIAAVEHGSFEKSAVPHRRSNRSASITFVQAATKSRTNFARLSSCAYSSAYERSTEFEPNTRSTRVAVQRTRPPARSRTSYRFVPTGTHSKAMSVRFTKKSVVSAPGRSVRTPWRVPPWFVPSTRMPPSSTVISRAVRPISCVRSSSSSSGFTANSRASQLR